MSLRIDTAEWISGSLIIGETGLGVLGSAIPSTGDNGAGYAYNDLSIPADATKEICGRITTWPSSGTLFAYEDTSFEFSGAADGAYSFAYQLYVDGVATGSPQTVTLTVGVVNGVSSGTPAALSISAATASAVGTLVGNGVASGSPSVLSISAVSAIGTGTSAGNGVGIGSPHAVTISAANASAVGTAQANGIASGSPSSLSIVAPGAIAGMFVYTRAPRGSNSSIVKAKTSRPANIGGSRAVASNVTRH